VESAADIGSAERINGWGRMRSRLGKAVRQRFALQLRKHVPAFEPDTTAIVPSGWKVFRWQACSDLACYVVLCFDRGHDRFTIECAWSHSNTFPQYGALQYPRDWPVQEIIRDEPVGGQFRFRLAYLWQPDDYWWWLVPEAQVKALQEKFIDAVIARDVADVMHAMDDPPISEALVNVPAAVDDAVQKIVEHGMPYFHGIIGTAPER
jgi:hypothetical protein